MRNPFRTLASVIAGIVAGMLIIAVVEALNSKVYPPPHGFDPSDGDALKAYVAQLPLGAFLFILAGWGVGTFVGTWVGTRIGPGHHLAPGLIVGAVLLVAGIANMLMLPHPTWFWVSALVVFALSTCSGTRLGASHS